MKQILSIVLLCLVMGCRSKSEKIATSLEDFMMATYPTATFKIVSEGNHYQLIINDNGNTVNEINLQSMMEETLGNFYLEFYKSTSDAATNSEFIISYKSATFRWKSETYDLFELSKMYTVE